MLPFLKPKATAGLIISQRKPDGNGIEEQHSAGDEDHALVACMEDLHRAQKSGDMKAAASAFRAAFEVLESEPHEEAQEPSMDEQG